jgi:TPR repeat protein
MREHEIGSAISELEALVDQESSLAMAALGNIYLYGSYGIPTDEPKGEALLFQSAKLGSIEGGYRLACYLDYKHRHAEAFEIYEELASRGFSPAIYRLGWAYHDGRWVEQNTVKARELFFSAYRKGHLRAQQKLSYDLRKSPKVREKLAGLYLLATLIIPRKLRYVRQPSSDALRD